MTPVEFIQTLKAGDTFTTVVCTGFQGRNQEVVQVVVRKLTATQIVISGLFGKEGRYRRDTGNRIGNHWTKFPLSASPEKIIAAKEDKETRVLREAMIIYKWQEVDLTKLHAIWSILNDKDK